MREGKFTVPVHPDAVTKDGKLYHPTGHFAYGELKRTVSPSLRSTGMLHPMEMPASYFFDFPRFHQYALEPDVQMGRRGVAGWNGLHHDEGLWMPLELARWAWFQTVAVRLGGMWTGFKEGVVNWWRGLDWEDPNTKWWLIGGAIAAVGGIIASPFLIAAATSATMGISFGMALTMVTRDRPRLS